MDPADTAAVRALKEKRPSTVGQLRAVLGLLSYYRQYIQDFSKIAGPLYDLLKGAAETKEEVRKVAASKWIKSKKRGVPSQKPILWLEHHQQRLEKLIDCLAEPPILGFPDFPKTFILHTDASNWVLVTWCCSVPKAREETESHCIWIAHTDSR